MLTLISNYTRTILKQHCTTLPHTHFELAKATIVPEHIISAIIFCIQKVASEANKVFTNVCDLKCSQPKDYKLLGKLRLFGIKYLIATHLRSTTTTLLSCIVWTRRTREVGYWADEMGCENIYLAYHR